MAATAETRFLVIADLTGYTAYLSGNELEHAPAIAGDLLETIVGRLDPPFRLAKFEGDAAFLWVEDGRADGLLDNKDDATYPLPMTGGVKHNRRRGRTRISGKHQVTLPVDALAGAGLKVGDRLRADVSGPGRITLVREDDPLEQFAGALTGVYPEGYLDDLRREWT